MSQKLWFAARLSGDHITLIDESFWTDGQKARQDFFVRYATTPAFLMESPNGKTCFIIQSPRGQRLEPKAFDVPKAIQEAFAKAPKTILREDRNSIVSTMPGWSKMTSVPKGIKLIESFSKTYEDNKTACLTLFECGGWYHSVMTVTEGDQPDIIGSKPQNIIERSVSPIEQIAHEAHVERKRRTYRASCGADICNCGCQKKTNDPKALADTIKDQEQHQMVDEALLAFCVREGNALHMAKSWSPLSKVLSEYYAEQDRLPLSVVSEANLCIAEGKTCWSTIVENQNATWPMQTGNPIKDFVLNKQRHACVENIQDAFDLVKKIFTDTMKAHGISDKDVSFYRPAEYFEKHIESAPDPRGVLFAIIDGSELYKAISGFYDNADYKKFSSDLRKNLNDAGFTYGFSENAVYVSIVPIAGSVVEKSQSEGFLLEIELSNGDHRAAFTEGVRSGMRHGEECFFMAPIVENDEIVGYSVGAPIQRFIENNKLVSGQKIARICMRNSNDVLKEHQAILFEQNIPDMKVLTWMMVGNDGNAIPVREGFNDEWSPLPLIEASTDMISYEHRCPEVGEIILDPRPFQDHLVKVLEAKCNDVKGDSTKGRPHDHQEYVLKVEVLHTGEKFDYTIRPANWSENKNAPVGVLKVDPLDYLQIHADQKTIAAYQQRHQPMTEADGSATLSHDVVRSGSFWSDNPSDANWRFDSGNPVFRRDHPVQKQSFTVKVFEIGSEDPPLQSRKGQFSTIQDAVDEGKHLAHAADKGPEMFIIRVCDEDDAIVHEEQYDGKTGFNENRANRFVANAVDESGNKRGFRGTTFDNIPEAVKAARRLAEGDLPEDKREPKTFALHVYQNNKLVHEETFVRPAIVSNESIEPPQPSNTGLDDKVAQDPLTQGALNPEKSGYSRAPKRILATGSTHPDADKLPIVGPAVGEGKNTADLSLETFLFNESDDELSIEDGFDLRGKDPQTRIELTCIDHHEAPERTPETKAQWAKAKEIAEKHGVAMRAEVNPITGYGDCYMYPPEEKLLEIIKALDAANVGYDNIDLSEKAPEELEAAVKKHVGNVAAVNRGEYP